MGTVMTPVLQRRTPGTGRFRHLPKGLQLLSGGTGIPGQVSRLYNLGLRNTAEGYSRCVVSSDSPRKQLKEGPTACGSLRLALYQW